MRITNVLGLVAIALSQMGGCHEGNLNDVSITLSTVTSLVSRDASGVVGSNSSTNCSLSSDGRYVAFDTLVAFAPQDTNGTSDVYVLDQVTKTLELISINASGTGAGAAVSSKPRVTGDGRFVAFQSHAHDLVTGVTDTSGAGASSDVFLRDRTQKVTAIVSIKQDGITAAGDDSENAAVVADATYVYVAFESAEDVLGDTSEGDNDDDVFVRRMSIASLTSGTTTTVSRTFADNDNAGGNRPSIGHDASNVYVVFDSTQTAANMVSGGLDGNTNGEDVFRSPILKSNFQRDNNNRIVISIAIGGKTGKAASLGGVCTPDGKFVAFTSYANNLDTSLGLPSSNSNLHVYRRDVVGALTVGVSVDSSGIPGNSGSLTPFSISDDGSRIAFSSNAFDLASGDTNGVSDVFLRYVSLGTTVRVSKSTFGDEANSDCLSPAISGDGRFIGFHSQATTLVNGDSNGRSDIFVSGPY